MKTLKIVGTALALIFCLELQAYEASVFLKRQWSEGINRMCQYQDGTVLPMKTRSCPSRKPKAGSEPYVAGSKLAETLANNRALQKERTQENALTRVYREHPDARQIFQSSGFQKFISEDSNRRSAYRKATSSQNPSAADVEFLLILWKAMPLLKSPAFHNTPPNQRARLISLFRKANTGDLKALKAFVREAQYIVDRG